METVGIISYGAYVPRLRITAHEIASVWGKDGATISKGLGIIEKSVPSIDQDTATISVEEALRAYTGTAAYAGFQEHRLGTIEAGKLADLVILDRDPLTIPADELDQVRVTHTIVGGRIVWSAVSP